MLFIKIVSPSVAVMTNACWPLIAALIAAPLVVPALKIIIVRAAVVKKTSARLLIFVLVAWFNVNLIKPFVAIPVVLANVKILNALTEELLLPAREPNVTLVHKMIVEGFVALNLV